MTQGKLIALGQPNSDIERTLRRRLRIVQLGKSGLIEEVWKYIKNHIWPRINAVFQIMQDRTYKEPGPVWFALQ